MSRDLVGEAGEPITREDLGRMFRQAPEARPPGPPRLGIEVEWLPFDPVTGAAWPYVGPRGVEQLFRRLVAEGYEVPGGEDPPTHLRKGARTINVEPGGQAELSGSPVTDFGAAAAEVEALQAVLDAVSREHGMAFLAHGVQPVATADAVEQVPKRRYRCMVDYLQRFGGPRFRDMMRLTCSVQISLDYASEADAGRKLRAATLLSPVVAALFANSPVLHGRPTGRQSERTAIWRQTAPTHCGALRTMLAPEAFTFEPLIEELLAIPTMLLRAPDGGVAIGTGEPFGKLLDEGIEGRPVTRADWDVHLSTVFTDARIKSTGAMIECRAADGPPSRAILAAPALYTGLLYHEPALDAVLQMLAPIGGCYDQAMEAAADHGLGGALPDGLRLLELAREVVALAEGGLRARGLGEERYLDPVQEVAATGRTFADAALEAFTRGGPAALLAASR